MLAEESKKRNVAYKIRIGDILKSKPIIQEGKFLFLELGENKIVRVNLLANVVDKFVNDGEKKYASLTLDDASGQIKLKSFGDDINLVKDIVQGDSLQIIGNVREYNNELYIMPEIVKKVEPKWLLVRKLEIQKSRKDMPAKTNLPLRDLILEKIKNGEKEGGVDIDNLIMEIEASADLINQEVKKVLEDGLVYEPRPGRLRYLG
ncbi:MAG: OB-fold nucleic acid binding domain-containing protein [Nanoarchaeota archaeon]|nr:OB-fold nucleic acid binding domain-containing protein [Nanoarchaeota archaeon]